MNAPSDQQLLRDYTGGRSEAAFAELVRRHVDLVYCAARRMVRDAHLAEDVTQSAFVALARNARQLTDRAVLSGWLHRTAQNIAAQTVRTDVRRRAREQEAAAMNELLATESDTLWEQVAPHLDAALGELSEADRDALLLRYFERKSAGEMAQRLGISDEAAQKRVSRAVERLREFFAKRGVAAGASGLVVVITANGVQAAPAGLAVTISAAAALAGTTIAAATSANVTQAIAMTTIQKALIAATLAVAVGTGIYTARQAAHRRAEVQTLRQQGTPLAEQVRQAQRDRDDATNRLAAAAEENKRLKSGQPMTELLKLRGEAARLRSAANDPETSAIKTSLAKVNLLKQRLEETPGAKIPEFRFLTEEDWLSAAKGNLNTQDDYRRAFAALRNAAEHAFAPLLQAALRQCLQANQGQFPTDLSQVQPFFTSPVEEALLERWQTAPAGNYPNMGDFGSPSVLTQKAAVDEDYDMCAVLGPQGDGWCNFKVENAFQALLPVYQAYLAVHSQTDLNNNGQIDLSRLKPYVQTPGQQTALEVLLQAQNGPRNWR